MANTVEIIITGKNLTKPEFDKAVADARAAGKNIGDALSKGVGEEVSKQLPAKVKEPLQKTPEPAKDSGSKAGAAFAYAFSDQIRTDLRSNVGSIVSGEGERAGTAFTAKFGDKVKSGIASDSIMAALGPAGLEAIAGKSGDKAGFNFTEAMGGRVRADLPAKVQKPIEDSAKKAAQNAGGAISPLIVGAFAAAATVGPALVLAATATAVIGAGVLITKGNAQLAASYAELGEHASAAIQAAAAPLIPSLLSAVQILDQGVAKIGPELTSVFSAVAPDVTAIASGLVSLVSNTLPGMASGLRAIAPYAQDLAVDFGKIGSGLGGFFQGLGSGASGGMAGLNALSDVLRELLTDIGSIVGSLSNGLGPALHDVSDIVIPLAHGVTEFVGSLSPTTIRVAADATAALFLAFKGASLAGLLAEGATFVGFLKAATAGEIALTGATGLTGKAMAALGLAEDAALGPLGLLAAGVTALGLAAAATGKQTADLGVGTDKMTQTLSSAAAGSAAAATAIDNMVHALRGAQMQGQDTSAGISQVDQALAKLAQSDPGASAKEYAVVLKDLNLTAAQGAQDFPAYAQATKDAAASQSAAAAGADDLTVALNASRSASIASAQQSATGVLASLGLSKGISSVTDGLYNSLTAYTAATGAASGYNSILQALNGTTASLDDAQNSMAQQLLTLKTSFKANADSMDLNTQAGINNRQSLSAAAKTAVDLATAQYQATGDMGKANQTLQQQENQILNNIGVTGTLRDKVKAYLDQIMQIPKGVTTNVTANTDSAVQHVKNVIKWIDGQSASFYVGSTGPGARAAQPGLAHGGVRGAASGGARGGLTWVGEQGPELIPLQPGTTVHSNPDSMRMASQGGSGGGVATIVLEVAGNSDDWLVQAIRHAIRVRGGNGANSVQIVLGQNF